MVDVFAFKLAVGHDVKQGGEWGAGFFDAFAVEVFHGHTLLGFGDVVHAVGKDGGVLQLGVEHVVGEDFVGIVEHASEEVTDEFVGDAVTQARGKHGFAVVVGVVFKRFEHAIGNELGGFNFGGGQAAPNFRNKKADVVADTVFGADIACRGGEPVEPGEDVADQSGVEVGGGTQGVEGALGEGAFAACTGGGGTFAGERADEVHEEFGKLLEMDGVVNGQGANACVVIGRVVAPTNEHGVNRKGAGLVVGECLGPSAKRDRPSKG